MLVKCNVKPSNVVSSYNPIRQTIPMVYNSIGEIKFVHIVFTAKFLETHIVTSKLICVSDISKVSLVGAIVLIYFPETILIIIIIFVY